MSQLHRIAAQGFGAQTEAGTGLVVPYRVGCLLTERVAGVTGR